MMSFPKTLGEWTIEALRDVVARGVFESDDFDLKEMLPHNSDEKSKLKLRTTCAAFANSGGGFLVYGVVDNKALDFNGRIKGIESHIDFPEHFGNFPAASSPTIHWAFKNPPLGIGDNHSVHIVHIPRSWKSPHAVDAGGGKWLFPKRTNKGTELMAIEEVRSMFLSFYEKRIRLQLLQSELSELKQMAEMAGEASQNSPEESYSVTTFDLTIMQSVIAETYPLTAANTKLLEELSSLRHIVRTANTVILSFIRKMELPLSDRNEICIKHKLWMGTQMNLIQNRCDKALLLLAPLLIV